MRHRSTSRNPTTPVGTFGYHPMLAFCDNTGEFLASALRRGNAGSNTALDHVMVLDAALAQIPDAHRHGTPILARADTAVCTREFLTHIRRLREQALGPTATARVASRRGPSIRGVSRSSQKPTSTRARPATARWNARTTLILPMPASPDRSTTDPAPALARTRTESSVASGASRSRSGAAITHRGSHPHTTPGPSDVSAYALGRSGADLGHSRRRSGQHRAPAGQRSPTPPTPAEADPLPTTTGRTRRTPQ